MAAAIACNVLLFAPFTLYTGNPDEFSVSLPAVLATYVLPGVIGIAALAAIGALLPEPPFRRYVAVLAALAVLMWLQGTFLVWDYGVLDGKAIPWLATGGRGAVDTSIWIGVLLIALYGYRRFGRMLVLGAAITVVIQIIAIGAGMLSGSTAKMMLVDSEYDEQQYQAMFRFSPERNIVHIVMDGFQSDIFADIVNDPQHEELGASLTGFTFFEQHMGVFPYTRMTVPLYLSGKTYVNHMPADDFIEQAMRGTTIPNVAEAAGFEVDIAAQVSLRKMYTKGRYTNAYEIPANRHASQRDYVVSDAVQLLDLSLFRLTPHFVKAYIYQDGLWFVQRWFRDAQYLTIRYFSELAFLEEIANGLKVDRDTPVYKLFHVMLSHRPTVGNERCEYDRVRNTTRENVTNQARCGLAAVVKVLEAMKRLGVYDNSLIVLMGDHGAWVAASGYEAPADGDPSDTGGPSAVMAGMAAPVLAIKPVGSSGPILVSPAPTTIGDVPATMAALMGLQARFDGQDAFSLPEDEPRPRRFFNHAYGENADHPGYLFTMAEYEINGSPFDYDAWRYLGVRLPGGRMKTAHPPQ